MPVVKMPDGTNVRFPDDMPPQQIQSMILKKFPEIRQTEADYAGQVPNIGRKGDMVAGDVVRKVPNAALEEGVLLGGRGELTGAMKAPFIAATEGLPIGEAYQQGMARSDAELQRMRDEFPIGSAAGELTGAVISGAVPGGAAARGAKMWQKMAGGAALGAGYGGVYGGLSAQPGQRMEGARQGATTGAIIGGAIPPIGAGIGKATNAVSNWRSGRKAMRNAADQLKDEFDVTPSALKRVYQGYADDAAGGYVRTPRQGDFLADTSPQLRAQAQGLANKPGQAQSMIFDEVTQRGAGAGGRISGVVDDTVGRDIGRVATQEILDDEAAAAGKLFNIAKQTDQVFPTGPINAQIDDALANAQGPVRRVLLNVRNQFPALKQETANAEQLHQVRMALDDMLEKAGQFGTSAGRNAKSALKQIRNQIDSRLKTINGWAAADREFSAVMGRKSAFEMGQQIFQRRAGSPDQLMKMLAGMDDGAREYFRRGARDQIAEILGTARNDVLAARRDLLDKGWNKEKLQILLGKEQASKLMNALEDEARWVDFATRVTKNSETARNEAAKKLYPDTSPSEEIVGQLRQSSISGLAMGEVYKLVNRIVNGIAGGRRDKMNADAAKLLMSTGEARDLATRVMQELSKIRDSGMTKGQKVEHIVNSLGFAVPASTQAQLR